MLGNLINLIFRWLSIRRWNNYPRIEEFTENEHISLKLQISFIVSKILQEKWHKINLTYIYKSFFWNSFFTFIYSDIKFDVKNYLKNQYPQIYQKLWQQILDFFQTLNLPNQLIDDFYEIVQNKHNNLFTQKNNIETDIINFTKAFETKLEIENNARFYPRSYQNIPKTIDQQIKNISQKIWFNELELLKNYCSNLIKLKFAYRWNKMKRNYPVSVLAHLFLVFSFSYILWKLKNFNNKQLEDILNKSLLHDIPEALTWDVITPTKKAAPGFTKVLEGIEEKLVDKYIINIFSKYKFINQFKTYLLHPFEWENWKIAKYSDHLSALFESKIEEQEYFERIYKDIKKFLWKINDTELDYILKYWIDYFDEDVEVKWKKFIWID